ncbi:MAG: hypothetical protein Q9180_007754, partial [Flavoplaca navasiana]
RRFVRLINKHIMPRAKKSVSDMNNKLLQPPRRSSRIQKPKAVTLPRKPKQNKAPFFLLPPEIRNMIFSYLVYHRTGLIRYEIHRKHGSPIQRWNVNRQFYREISALFYHVNTFKFFSGHVRTGMDPFGPRLDRIERCYLHLSLTRESSNAFLKWFVDEFVTAVARAKNLKYLIVRMAEHQKDCVQSLELLSGFRFAQVQLGQIRMFRTVSHGKYGRVEYLGKPECRVYEQRLERLMMNNGKPEKEVLAGLGNTYEAEPSLSTDLTGEALQKAQQQGGWDDEMDLFRFLGVMPRAENWFIEELNYTTR